MTATDVDTEVAEVIEFLPGLYADMDEDTYHADPVPAGSLSVSGAKKLLSPSCPAIFDWERRHPAPSTKAMNLGSAAHKLVLGRGADLVVVDAGNYQTKAARETRDAAFATGKIPLLPGEYREVAAMADALRAHPLASALFDPERGGIAEASLFWQEKRRTQAGCEAMIWRRSRLDWMPAINSDRVIIGDYKTAISSNPDEIARAVARFGYHQQHPWYVEAVKTLYPDVNVRFVFVFQEKTPPYVVTLVELDRDSVALGDDLNQQAIDTYVDCTETGVWPGYVPETEVRKISLPTWAFRR